MKERYIVLIEDNADDAYLASRVIGKVCDDRVVVARDGEEALDLLGRMVREGGQEQIRLVLLDLKLPKMNGMEVLENVRKSPELRQLPVAVLTSSEDEGDQERSRELGVRDYLFKPLTVESCRRALERCDHAAAASNL